MFAKLLTFLLVASTAFAAHYRNVTTDTTVIKDTYIVSTGVSDSITNYGTSGAFQVSQYARALIRFDNLRTLIGSGKALGLCTLVVYNNAAGADDGEMRFWRMKNEWGEGWDEGTGGYRMGGTSWPYRDMPSKPDTTPAASLPYKFDWRDSNLTTATNYQDSCGSCFAHSAADAFEMAAKIQNSERQISYNAGNGVGADRNTAVDDKENVTSTGWISILLRPSSVKAAYSDPTNKECGYVLGWVSGDYTFWSSEAADAANRPRVYMLYGRHDGGIDEDKSAEFIGTTDISETVLKGGADTTTNFGSDSLLQMNSTNTAILFKMNSISTKLGDSLLYLGSTSSEGMGGIVCSLKVKTVTSAGIFNVHDALKKWDENQATSRIWTTGSRWGTNFAAKVNELDLSEQQLLDCSNESCNGGACRNVMEFFRMNTIYSEEQYPYEAYDFNDCDTAGLGAVSYAELKWWWPVNTSNRWKVKQAVYVRPITASIGYDATYQSIDSVICYQPDLGTQSKTHSVTIVGWNDSISCGLGAGTDSLGAWIMKDERGELWGNLGYGYVSYANKKVFQYDTYDPTGSYTSVMVETIQDPVLWSTPGMQQGVDYDTNYFAAVNNTGGENDSMFIPIPADIMQSWYDSPSTNYGMAITHRAGVPVGTMVNAAMISSEVTNPGSLAYKPRLIVHSSDRVTKLGNVKLGNVKIGN